MRVTLRTVVLLALTVAALVGCTPQSSVPAEAALSDEARDAARTAVDGQWEGRAEVDGRMHHFMLEFEDEALRVAVDGRWQPWRAWVPLRVVEDEAQGQARWSLRFVVVHPTHLEGEGLRMQGEQFYLDSMPDLIFEPLERHE